MSPSTRPNYDLVIIINRLQARTAEVRGFAQLTCGNEAPNALASAYYRASDDTGVVLTTVAGSRASWQLSWLVVHATGEGFSAITESMLRPERWQWFVNRRLQTFDRLGTDRQRISVCLSRIVWAGNVSAHRRRIGRLRTSDDSPTCSGILMDDTALAFSD